ncbi:magnesium transporter [Pelolinea submarina]|uniref:Magnesium transporter MgtE n=1 Tax=Pelolinea submarina TaxID=913107 RepID=A0A347ZR41_9CHLR|nr:magnesium transporter [Pelolinea submarina]REG11674.1 magnesium transporter [Pelolinea submarina]BBB47772.1 magnesium transporter [Pelolinea submarina]
MTVYEIDVDTLLVQVKDLLEHGDPKSAAILLEGLRPADQAGVFDDLNPEEQDAILPKLNPEDSADILEELEEEDAVVVADRLRADKLATIMDHMEPDEAADLLGDIEPEKASRVLDAMLDATEVEPLLKHQDQTAGGLMTSASIVLKAGMSVKTAISYLRKLTPEDEDIYYLFVTDRADKLVGVVNLRSLVTQPATAKISDIMNTDVLSVQADADQEEAAKLMKRYDLLALPVVDNNQRLLGVITYDDSFDIMEDEATEDIYRLAGIPEETPSDLPLGEAVKKRLPWLVVNLFMALISASVLSLFESTISQMAALAAFFPIVAGVSGSAGTQTLTVTVRSIALGEIEPKNAIKVIANQFLLSLVNGIAVGLIIALIAVVWKQSLMLGMIAGIATLVNIISTAFTGVVIPLAIQKFKSDPALASPIIVTALTDALGYLVYLGLASALLAWLI